MYWVGSKADGEGQGNGGKPKYGGEEHEVLRNQCKKCVIYEGQTVWHMP